MSRASKIAVLAALCPLAVLAASAGCGEGATMGGDAGTGDDGPRARPVPVAEKAQPRHDRGGRQGSPPGRLRVARRGHPFVVVRKGSEVDVRAEPGGEVVETVNAHTAFGSPSVFAVFERDGRWAGVPSAFLPNGRLGWIHLDPDLMRAGSTDSSITVDLSERSARLLEGGRTVRTFAVTVDSPGAETPTGRFAVTDTFRGGLDPVYGCCAVAITARQTKVPSDWIGGDRIAFHGTSGPLGVAASHGCVRAADADVSALVNRVSLGTPVTIRG